jgi:Uncharacterized conserved protein
MGKALIGLLTDFGTKDYFVASLKGVILSINPDAEIVDLTHDLPDFNQAAAAFVLWACYRFFPAGTIFLTVVDPGVVASAALFWAELSVIFPRPGQWGAGPGFGKRKS